MSSYARPTISVIVVNFNAGALLGLCIERIRKATTPVELIVVDNQSSDISKVWARRFSSRNAEKYIQNDRNLGFSAAVNIGATAASGDLLVVINPDCLVWPHSIDRLCKFLNDQKEVGLVGGLVFGIHGCEQSGCRRYDVTPVRSVGKMLGKLFPFRNLPTIDMTREPIPQSSIDVDAVSGSFFAIKKSLYDQLGGLDEAYFLHFEDLDLCRRVRQAGYRVVFNPNVSVIHVGAVSSGIKSIELVRHKHRSLKIYFGKYLGRYSFAVWMVSTMSQLYVWVRILYEFIGSKKEHSNRLDRFEGTWNATNANDVFVIGDQCRLLHSVVMRLATRGYNIVVETNDPQKAPKIPNVSWVASEYREKVPEEDYPEFAWNLCLGSAEQFKGYRKRFLPQKFDRQLLIETGVRVNVVNERNTVENAIETERNMDWIQKGSLCLRLRTRNGSKEHIYNVNNNNDLSVIHEFENEEMSEIDNHERAHVDDVAELCLDVLVGISQQEFGAYNQKILKGALDRFNQCIRSL